MRTATTLSVILILAAGVGCSRQSKAADDLASLQMSNLCATSADRFWKKYVADNMPLAGAPVPFQYRSHYNNELRRCIISIQESSPNGDGLTVVRIFDAIEGYELASMTTKAGKVVGLWNDEKSITPDDRNVAWFRGLTAH